MSWLRHSPTTLSDMNEFGAPCHFSSSKNLTSGYKVLVICRNPWTNNFKQWLTLSPWCVPRVWHSSWHINANDTCVQEHGWLTRPTCTVSRAICCSSVYIFISSNIYPQSLVYIHSLQPILIFSGIHIHSLWFMFIVFTEVLSSSPKCSLQSCHPLNFPSISLPLFRGNNYCLEDNCLLLLQFSLQRAELVSVLLPVFLMWPTWKGGTVLDGPRDRCHLFYTGRELLGCDFEETGLTWSQRQRWRKCLSAQYHLLRPRLSFPQHISGRMVNRLGGTEKAEDRKLRPGPVPQCSTDWRLTGWRRWRVTPSPEGV